MNKPSEQNFQSTSNSSQRAIEDGFPFESISDIAEIESWRKEIYRPIYHIHKWWAQRLGSVFRAVIVGSIANKGEDVIRKFHSPTSFPGVVVFDPFMGSGTTVGEAHKLGCTAIGRDINPVAVRTVRSALSKIDRKNLQETFDQLNETVGVTLRNLYLGLDSEGKECDVLYYFWVKVILCPSCQSSVDLFSNYIFSKHAYVKKSPQAQILCPHCGGLNVSRYDSTDVKCKHCEESFNPQIGPVRRSAAVCP